MTFSIENPEEAATIPLRKICLKKRSEELGLKVLRSSLILTFLEELYIRIFAIHQNMNFLINLKSIAPVIVCTTVVCIVGLKIEQTYEETIQKIVYAFLVFTNFFFHEPENHFRCYFQTSYENYRPRVMGLNMSLVDFELQCYEFGYLASRKTHGTVFSSDI